MLRIFNKIKLLWSKAVSFKAGGNEQPSVDIERIPLAWNSTAIHEQNNIVDNEFLARYLSPFALNNSSHLLDPKLEELRQHPERAKLSVLVGVALMQQGNNNEARRFLQIAQEWGESKETISRLLIASTHSSLGRAMSLVGREVDSKHHFNAATEIELSRGVADLVTLTKPAEQMKENLASAQIARRHIASTAFCSDPSSLAFSPTLLVTKNLGAAWAGNTINTSIFRHHGILTWKRIQYLAFYFDEKCIRLVQRNLDTEEIKTYNLFGTYNLVDAHNSISLGIDRSGYLHISYDQHATQLNYRRALAPNSITEWTEEIMMTGREEQRVSYPTFILPRKGCPLTMLYRDGIHDKGIARIKSYDEESQQWTDYPDPILSGAEQKPWTSNAYWNHPAIGNDGSLHLSFVWRTRPPGSERQVNNKDIGYAFSNDNGATWLNSKNRIFLLPITQVTSETIYSIPLGSNLINQCGMAVDGENRPHIVFYSDDLDGIPQYQHLWFDGRQWHHQFISERKNAFQLQGRGTLRIPISRPEIVIDSSDNVFVIYRADITEDKMAVTILPAPDYEFSPENTKILWEENVGYSEPIIDRERWRNENIFSIMIQNNDQPDEDKGHDVTMRPVTLLDFKFKLDES